MEMGYYDEPYGEQEPTEQDYCVMSGHPFLLDDETGWFTCRCGYVTSPPYDEPHDEYSAYHADFKDEYLSLVTHDLYSPEDTIVTVGRLLEKESAETIQRLIEITKKSNPRHIDPTTGFEELLALGVHLDSVGKLSITAVVTDMRRHDPEIKYYGFYDGAYTALSTPEHFKLVQTAARLYSLLIRSDSASWGWETDIPKCIVGIYRELAEQPEKIAAVAAVFNSRPESPPQATQLALALLRGEVDPVAPSISEGLL